MQRQLSDLEIGFSGMTSLGLRTASGESSESSESSSTGSHVSNESMLPSAISKREERDISSGFRNVSLASAQLPVSKLASRQTNAESKPPQLSSDANISRQASTSSRQTSSESKPLSKVKALAQAFNNLTAANGPVRRRTSVSGHKRSDSWTTKIRRSLSLSSKKDQDPANQNGGDLAVTTEDVEPASPVKEEANIGDGDDETKLKSESGVKPAGEVKSVEKIEPAEKMEPEVWAKEEEIQLTNSPSGSPSMVPTELPFDLSILDSIIPDTRASFIFPLVSASTRQSADSYSHFTDHSGDVSQPFYFSPLNHQSSSIYSRSENGGSPPKSSSPLPKSKTGLPDSLRVGERSEVSPSKSHRRINATTSSIQFGAGGMKGGLLSSRFDHSSTTPMLPTHILDEASKGVDYTAYLAHDYTTYLDENFPVDTTLVPAIPARSPARLLRPSVFPGDQANRFGNEVDQFETSSRNLAPSSSTLPHEAIGRFGNAFGSEEGVHKQQYQETMHGLAKNRLKKEARDLGRLSEQAADDLVGKEIFAEEDRGDDSTWL